MNTKPTCLAFLLSTNPPENWNVSHKGFFDQGKHAFQWGVGYDKAKINDKLNEWEFQDSAGYALPYQPNMLRLNKVIKSSAALDINKFSGYIQDNILLIRLLEIK